MNSKIALFYNAWGDSEERLASEGSESGVVPIHYSQLVCQGIKNQWEIFFGEQELNLFNLFYFHTVGDKNETLPLLLEYAKENEIIVVDHYLTKSGGAFRKRKSCEAMMLLKNGIAYPKTSFIADREELKKIIKDLPKPIIIKSTSGRHGSGTFLIESEEQLEKILLGRNQTNFLIQEYIPNDGDYRLFLIGYQVVAGFKRQIKEQKLILNRSQGQSVPLAEIPPEIAQEAEKAAKILGIEIAGVDLVIDKRDGKVKVIEVNQAPEFIVMEKRTGINIGKKIIEYLANKTND